MDWSYWAAKPSLALPQTLLGTVRKLLEERLADFLSDLEALVNIDSGTYDQVDVTAASHWLGSRLAPWNGTICRHSGTGFADSFSVTLLGAGTANVMLLGHMDTVFPHGTAAIRPFHIEDNRALGPGTCDMKAGLLAGIYAVEALRSADWGSYHELRCVFTSDEEVGAPSSRDFIETMATGMDAVLVLEAGRENGDIVGQRRGGGFYQLEVHGRSAHAGVEPEKGRSAAVSLCRQVVSLHELTDLAAGRTVNVGTLQSGTRPNVVPDLAIAQVDLRANTQADMDRLLQEVETTLASQALPGTSYTWTQVQFRPPWEQNERTQWLVRLAQRVASELGFRVVAAATGGTSDGNFTAAMGIPTLDGLGPVGGLDHSPQEYVDIASIIPRTALLAGLIATICSD
ncbi:MAG: M20 family metallopeptidase [Ktedonobacterales bacterium]